MTYQVEVVPGLWIEEQFKNLNHALSAIYQFSKEHGKSLYDYDYCIHRRI